VPVIIASTKEALAARLVARARHDADLGVAARKETMTGVEGLMRSADEGVYLAKRNGRNCVACAQF